MNNKKRIVFQENGSLWNSHMLEIADLVLAALHLTAENHQ